MFGWCQPVNAQTSSYGELQAAYIFNFAKYIKWPQPEYKVFVIGVFGEDPMLLILQNALKGKKAAGKEIEIRIVTADNDLAQCHIVYLPESHSRDFYSLITATLGKHILIVTEGDFIKKGASISFVVEDDRLRFKLKKSVLSKSGLVASEGLLKLAIQL